ncbi:MAG: hypothetical protein AAFQ59_18720 [Pseudomonadota bacterium]
MRTNLVSFRCVIMLFFASLIPETLIAEPGTDRAIIKECAAEVLATRNILKMVRDAGYQISLNEIIAFEELSDTYIALLLFADLGFDVREIPEEKAAELMSLLGKQIQRKSDGFVSSAGNFGVPNATKTVLERVKECNETLAADLAEAKEKLNKLESE